MGVSLSARPARPRWTTVRCSAVASSPRSRPGDAYRLATGPLRATRHGRAGYPGTPLPRRGPTSRKTGLPSRSNRPPALVEQTSAAELTGSR